MNHLLQVIQLAALTAAASCFSVSTTSSPKQTPSEVSILEPRRNVASPDDEQLRQMQKKHRPIVKTFEPAVFNPHPLLTNRHLQTISGVFLRKNMDCAYVDDGGVGGVAKVLQAILSSDAALRADESSNAFWHERQRITTSCKRDFFSVDIKYASERKTTYQSVNSNGLVVIIHGLESNSNSSLSTDMAAAFHNDGLDVVCINFRGCCGTPNLTLGGYHVGFTDDLKHFLQLISNLWDEDELFEKRPIYLSGFSLGANVVVKCLGELGDAALKYYNVHGAAVCGAPLDCERNVKYLDSNPIYSGNFLKTLKKRAQFQLEQHCEGDPNTSQFDYQGAVSASTVADFDNAFIAPIYGFQDNIDYYRCSSCYYYLPGVAVPLYIINAEDDPFFDPNFFPTEESVDGGALAPIKLVRAKHGGHLGFMFHQLHKKEKDHDAVASWMPLELSRFIRHVVDSHSQ